MPKIPPEQVVASRALALSLVAAALVSACGGGGGTAGADAAKASVASSTTVLDMNVVQLSAEVGAQVALPAFHVAPVILDPPSDVDAAYNAASVNMRPRTQAVQRAQAGLSTSRLTLETMLAAQPVATGSPVAPDKATPLAATGTVSTYTPAQIRAAYGLPVLPVAGATLTPTQAAQMGAGQTIYIVDAMHDPNAAAELAAFDQKFGLPPCTTRTIATNAALPLPAPSANACDFSVVYNTSGGTMTTTAPAYDSGWATEIALDVQWAHATAPLARIVLIEAADASLNSLLGAVNLANAMGPGVVSMSWGGSEGSWTTSVDAAFSAARMTYLAATGDSGAGVEWPAVSAHVVGVGGTSLTYAGSGPRSEVAWSGSGGGISQFLPAPGYQASGVPGLSAPTRRNVADVSFNADPYTGQYVAVMSSGAATANWISVGGTSLATPQWAGVIAVANALRAQAGNPALGAPHATLYGQVAATPVTYAADLRDVTQGADGSCSTCSAKVGYDTPTGLGTPNGSSLIATLSGAATVAAPPVVTSATINGAVGTPLSFTVSVSAANPVTYTLSGNPGGMTISATGVVSWAAPVAGTYSVAVAAVDTRTGLVGRGTYTVTIVAPSAPAVGSAAISGVVGTALSFQVSATAPDAVTYTLTGAPSGMTIAASGVVSWAAPVAGSYRVTVTAKDTRTGLTGSGVYTISIGTAPPPVVAGGTITGKPGAALSFTVSVTAADPVTYQLSGAPAGMTISSSGVVSWPSPLAGSYAVSVKATDSKTNASGQGVYTVKIGATAPTITAAAMTGVAGKPLTGAIVLADPGATSLSVAISGVPLGMTFTVNGLILTAHWATPVTGTYAMHVVLTDSAAATAQATIPITITAK